MNIWSTRNLSERFFPDKTRALHGSHLNLGQRMWSSFPYLRPIATVIEDTLDWFGIDSFGGSVMILLERAVILKKINSYRTDITIIAAIQI